jgi:hypothetical protein
LDAATSPRGEAAWDKVAGAAKAGANYVRSSTPKKVAHDIGDQLHRFRARVDPTATSQAPTLAGEVERNLRIGLNQGELAVDVGSALYGGAELTGLKEVAGLSKAATPAKYLARGYPRGLSEYFATQYKGIGHHFIPKRFEEDYGVPRAIIESPFFRRKPRGVSTGDFYELHHGVDPKYRGGKIHQDFGGGRWSGDELGWQKRGLLGRLWYGSPSQVKAAVIGPPVVGAGALVDHVYQDRSDR